MIAPRRVPRRRREPVTTSTSHARDTSGTTAAQENTVKITKDSHVDHKIPQRVVDYFALRFADRTAFFVETVELPEALGTVPCALHADVPDAECRFERRGDRTWTSRLCDRPERQTREVTVVAGPHEGEFILYTCYGGPQAPQEPGDPACRDVAASSAFWSTHALTAAKGGA